MVPTTNPLVKEHAVQSRSSWGQPPPGWGQPPLSSGWAPLVDPGPLQGVRSVARWLWPTLAVGGFLAVTGFVLTHDDPTPGLSVRGLATLTLAAAVVGLLTLHRRYGPRPLARALGEYAVVFVLAVLVATTGVPLNQPPPASPQQARAASDQRPALVKTLDRFGDWLAEWRAWAHTQSESSTRPPATTTTTRRTS